MNDMTISPNAALLARIAELEAKNAALQDKIATGNRKTASFKRSEKNPDYFIFSNGLMEKGVHPLTTAHIKVWRMIFDNVDVMRQALD